MRYHPLKGAAHPSGACPEKRVLALIDTGATHVVLKPNIVASLELPFAANMNNTVVGGGRHLVPSYAADIIFGTTTSFTVTDVLVLSQDLHGFDMLIGWDVLRFTDWQFNRDGSFSQTW